MRARLTARLDHQPGGPLTLALHRSGAGQLPPLSFRFDGPAAPPPPDRADAAAVLAVFAAMRRGLDLHIDGAVSAPLLDGMERFVEAWVTWRPDQYRAITVSAAQELPDPPRARGSAAMLYSGGLDSAATLIRHRDGLAGRANRRVTLAVLAHGFEVPLANTAWFERSRASAAATLDAAGVPWATLATDARATLAPDWEMEFVALCAGVLHLCRGSADVGLLASDDNWARKTTALPWSSNLATNPLLGSHGFPIETDAGGLTRSDRARLLPRLPAAHRNLRVCYLAPATGINCGRCGKCLRRMLQLHVAGVPPSPAFARQLSVAGVLGLAPRGRHLRANLVEIADDARRFGRRDRMVWALHAAIWQSRLGLVPPSRNEVISWLRRQYRRWRPKPPPA